ncbi:MAG: glycerol-3-phosphate 1-O-acyltransferase PlsY [Ruminococcaceae bacterium]|nr:glycerol-3-phosphate 1-O-acyltransferase PlsY [Oscillospiraceae bacterium]
MNILFLVGCLLFGYLLGSFNASIIFSRVKGSDIRNQGSKNAGLTNALRVFGKKAAVFVFIFDLLKAIVSAAVAVYVAKKLFPEMSQMKELAKYIAGFGAVLGHNFPLYFGFKGGKGILASWGVIMIFDWRIAIMLIVVFLLVVLSTRYVSLASVISSILFPIFVIALNIGAPDETTGVYIIISVLMAVLAVYRHRANISRLLSGTESKLGAKNDKKE